MKTTWRTPGCLINRTSWSRSPSKPNLGTSWPQSWSAVLMPRLNSWLRQIKFFGFVYWYVRWGDLQQKAGIIGVELMDWTHKYRTLMEAPTPSTFGGVQRFLFEPILSVVLEWSYVKRRGLCIRCHAYRVLGQSPRNASCNARKSNRYRSCRANPYRPTPPRMPCQGRSQPHLPLWFGDRE